MFHPNRRKVTVAADDGRIVGSDIINANSMFRRMKGLLGTDTLGPDQGCFLQPCSSIHCKGMKYAIDVVYLTKPSPFEEDGISCKVLHVETVPPGKMGSRVKGTNCILELPAGRAGECGISFGSVLHATFHD